MTPLIDLAPFYHFFYYVIGAIVLFVIGFAAGALQSAVWGDERLRKSRNFQRGVLKGTISEQLAPYLPGFPQDLKPSEAKFLGKPVDFIVFKGLDDNNVSEVVFIEVKSGRTYTNANEDSLRRAIETGRVKYIKYQVPSDIFKN